VKFAKEEAWDGSIQPVGAEHIDEGVNPPMHFQLKIMNSMGQLHLEKEAQVRSIHRALPQVSPLQHHSEGKGIEA